MRGDRDRSQLARTLTDTEQVPKIVREITLLCRSQAAKQADTSTAIQIALLTKALPKLTAKISALVRIMKKKHAF
jgi:hypothetical protein